jgi:exonuclease VII small subunit
MEIEAIKRSQRETTLELENLGKGSEVIDASINNKIQEIEKSITGIEDTIENIDTTVKENAKCKELLTQNIQKIQEIMKKKNPKDNKHRKEQKFPKQRVIKYLQ